MPQASSAGLDRESDPLRRSPLGVEDGDDWDPSEPGESVAQADELRRFLDLPIDVGVQLGHRLITFREVLGLRVGSVIRMDRSAGENADLLLERRVVGKGEIVVIEDMMGLRITELAYPGARPKGKREEE